MSLEVNLIGTDTEEDRMLNTLFKGKIPKKFVEVGKDKFVFPASSNFDFYKNFEVQDDNIFMACYPKTGSSWLQEAIWLINNDLDYDKLNRITPFERFSFLDIQGNINTGAISKLIKDEQVLKTMSEMMQKQSKTNFKTHLPWSLLPEQIQNGTKKPKIFVTIRNPYDTCISYYHFSRLAAGYVGDFDQFCQLFLSGRLNRGSFWKHIFSYWEQRDRPNVMIVRYSDMIEDFPSVVRKVADFLGKTLSDKQVAELTDFLSFENMKKNPALNRDNEIDAFHEPMGLTVERTAFVRQGKEGAYKAVMSPEMMKKFDAWVKENTAGTGFSF